MDNLSDSRKNIVLPELQAFLLEKELTQKKNVLCGPACRVFWGGREKLPLTRLGNGFCPLFVKCQGQSPLPFFHHI
jgi:hypothetical protein